MMMMNPSQVIFRALPVSKFPEAQSRSSQSIDADSAHMGCSSGLHALHTPRKHPRDVNGNMVRERTR